MMVMPSQGCFITLVQRGEGMVRETHGVCHRGHLLENLCYNAPSYPFRGLRMDLHSTTVDVADEYAAMEYYTEQGWTDGLPIVAPTRERVEACLSHADLLPRDVIGA